MNKMITESFPVLSVGANDFTNLVGYEPGQPETDETMKLVESMTREEWLVLAESMYSTLFDDEQWTEALRIGVEEVKAARSEATNS